MTQTTTEYNGCQIDHMAKVQVKGITATIDDKTKLEFSDGLLAVEWLTQSYRYGSEVQLVYYTRTKPEIRQRVNGHNGYYRVEIHMTRDQAAELIRSLR